MNLELVFDRGLFYYSREGLLKQTIKDCAGSASRGTPRAAKHPFGGRTAAAICKPSNARDSPSAAPSNQFSGSRCACRLAGSADHVSLAWNSFLNSRLIGETIALQSPAMTLDLLDKKNGK
jgi:hypothetical protein